MAIEDVIKAKSDELDPYFLNLIDAGNDALVPVEFYSVKPLPNGVPQKVSLDIDYF